MSKSNRRPRAGEQKARELAEQRERAMQQHMKIMTLAAIIRKYGEPGEDGSKSVIITPDDLTNPPEHERFTQTAGDEGVVFLSVEYPEPEEDDDAEPDEQIP